MSPEEVDYMVHIEEENERLKQQNKRYRERISVAMGMMHYGRNDKTNQIYGVLKEALEGDCEQ